MGSEREVAAAGEALSAASRAESAKGSTFPQSSHRKW